MTTDVATPALTVTASPARRLIALALTHRWTFVLWTAMSAWSAALFAVARSDYLNFRLARFDLGNMVQAVWSTAHGHPLATTDVTGEQTTRLAGHVDPVLALLVPLWWLAPTPLMLVAVQIAACALGALPVFWLGRRHLGSEKAASILALVYLTYPWVSWTAIDAMHPATLAIPLFLFAIWFLDTDRVWWFAVSATLVLATGEFMGLTLAALGIWYAIARRRWRLGVIVAVVGVAWTAICLEVIVPGFRGSHSPYYAHYQAFGGSPEKVVWSAVSDPIRFTSAVLSNRDLDYLLLLAAPLAGIFLLAPGLAAVALPRILENGLSDRPTSVDPRAHYVDAVIPFLIAATVFAVARVPPRLRLRVVTVVLAVSISAFILVGPRPGALEHSPIHYTNSLPAHRLDALRSAVSLIPDGVPVSSSNDAGAHLAARANAYTVPVVGRAQWILVDTWDPAVPALPVSRRDPKRIRQFVVEIEADSNWNEVFSRDGILVFRRMADE
jgi:uncharacterized membrane protein